MRFSFSGKAEGLLPLLLASSHLRMCLTCALTHGTWLTMWCLLCFSSFALTNVEAHLTAYEPLTPPHKFPVLAMMLPAVLWAAEEGGLVFLVVPVNFVKQRFYFMFVFFFPLRFWHKPLRKTVGLGNNLKPPNLLYLKVPLSSETSSLSLDLGYGPL